MHFDWPDRDKFTFDFLSNKLRFNYIPEHNDSEGSLDSDKEYFCQQFRKLFRECGESVRPSDIFSKEELATIKTLSKKCETPDLSELSELGVSNLQVKSLRKDWKPRYTIKGHIALDLWRKNYAKSIASKILGIADDDDYHEDFDKPLKDNQSFRLLYHPPGTYNRIIRDYFDITNGFLFPTPGFFGQDLDVLHQLNLLPWLVQERLYDVERLTKFDKFKETLVERRALTEDLSIKITDYFFRQVSEEYGKKEHRLSCFVFILAYIFKFEHAKLHSWYLSLVRKYFGDIGHAWHELRRQTSLPEGRSDLESPEEPPKEYYIPIKLQSLPPHKFTDVVNKIIQYSPPRNEKKETQDQIVIKALILQINLLVTDLWNTLNNNMIFYCIYYDYLFDGEKHIKEGHVPHRAPDYPEFFYDILVWLVDHFKKQESFESQRYKLTEEFLFLLTGIEVNAKNKYHDWKSRAKSPIVDAS